MKKRLFFATIALALVGCGGGSDEVDLTGRWTEGHMVMTLAQNGSNVSGIYTHTDGYAGSIVGTFNGSSLVATLLPSDPKRCQVRITLLYSDNRLSGTGATHNCTGTSSGPITLTR